MSRARAVLGIIAGAFLVLSSAMHSLLGWSRAAPSSRSSALPPSLTFALRMGWHFAGVAMLTFGVITIATFARRLRGEPVSLATPAVIAAAYELFGAWAFVASGYEPFFAIAFVLPGALLAIASLPGRPRPPDGR